MNKNMITIIKSILIFLLYFLYNAIIKYLLIKVGIDITSWSNNSLVILSLIINVSYIILLILLYKKELITELKDYKKNFNEYFKIGIKYWAIGLILMIVANYFILQIYPSESTNETLIQNQIKIYPLYIMFSTMIYAPFVEEIIFRKTTRGMFKNNIIYVLACGLLFGYLHTLANTSNPMELLYIIPYGTLGAVFAYMVVKTKNIFVPITFHFLHNSFLILTYMLSFFGGN